MPEHEPQPERSQQDVGEVAPMSEGNTPRRRARDRESPGRDERSHEQDHHRALLRVRIEVEATLRAAPSDRAESLDRLPVGRLVDLADRTDEFYLVRRDGQQWGWVHERALPSLKREVDLFLGAAEPRLVEPLQLRLVRAAFPQCEPSIEQLLTGIADVERLVRDAAGVMRCDRHALGRFEYALRSLVDRYDLATARSDDDPALGSAPSEPDAQPPTSSAAGELASDSAPLDLGRRGPCLVSPEALERLGAALRSFAGRLGPPHDPAFRSVIEHGLRAIGASLRTIEPLERLHHAMWTLDRGDELDVAMLDDLARELGAPHLAASRPAGPAAAPPRDPSVGRHSAPDAVPLSDPAGFPGERMPPLSICRREHWRRTARAVRCCGQTYSIESIRPAEAGSACYGTILVIRGRGFRDERSWHIGSGPTELLSEVIFPSDDGAGVRATEYESWTDDEVRVVVPAGATSGLVEMLVLCDESLRGGTVSSWCGLQTRSPGHDLRSAVVELDVAEIEELRLEHHGGSVVVRPGEEAHLTEEACAPVVLVFRASNAEHVTVRSDAGDVHRFSETESGASGSVAGELTLDDSRTRTYRVEVGSACGAPAERTIRIERFRAIHLRVRDGAPIAGEDLAVEVSISCSAHALDRADVPVSLELADPSPDISVSPGTVVFTGHETRRPVVVASFATACERNDLRATADEHRPGSLPLLYRATAAPISFAGTATIAFSGDPRLPSTLPPQSVTVALVLQADRRTLSIVSFPRISVPTGRGNTTTVVWTAGGTGMLDETGTRLTMPLGLEFRQSLSSVWDSGVDTTLVTGSATTPDGSLSGRGRPLDGTGMIALVGAGTFIGGWLGGEGPPWAMTPDRPVEYLITLAGTFSPVPRPCR